VWRFFVSASSFLMAGMPALAEQAEPCEIVEFKEKAGQVELFPIDQPATRVWIDNDDIPVPIQVSGKLYGRFIVLLDGEEYLVRRRNVKFPPDSPCSSPKICQIAGSVTTSTSALGSDSCAD